MLFTIGLLAYEGIKIAGDALIDEVCERFAKKLLDTATSRLSGAIGAGGKGILGGLSVLAKSGMPDLASIKDAFGSALESTGTTLVRSDVLQGLLDLAKAVEDKGDVEGALARYKSCLGTQRRG
jgi:hypothetical protein